MSQHCPATYVTGGNDPSSTGCDLKPGHSGAHEGLDPLGNEERFQWMGGGSVAGDRLPTRRARVVLAWEATR